MTAPLANSTRTNMTSKGQVLIPKHVRDTIGLVPGQPVEIGINELGQAVVVPGTSRHSEAPAQRSARIMAALDAASLRHRTGRPVDQMMAELRGDDPLP